MSKKYTFYKRKVRKASGKTTSIYYVRFRDPTTGERLSAVSTGCSKKGDAGTTILCLIEN